MAGASQEEVEKDTEELLLSLSKFHPTIPDSVTEFYLRKSGFQSNDPRVTRIVSLAAQKFLADVAHDALQQTKMRQAKDKKGGKEKKLVLTAQDLQATLRAYGVHTTKPETLGLAQPAAGRAAGGAAVPDSK
mmetsp:Transcript_20951/g.50592  ORF Transcript_20951/g.50592 Transcript_20951/m.50592 type:complete len:132 (+) Transcript_20951:140-535(+)